MGRFLFLVAHHLVALSLLSCPAFAARYVPIKVSVDGEVILEGNASDNGRPDADEVWDALKRVNLGETKAFKKLFGESVGDDLLILKKRSEKEQPLEITIGRCLRGNGQDDRPTCPPHAS